MTGGMNWPPVEATASTAPAKVGRYPIFFIKGIVKEPVLTTLATALPEMVRKSELLKMATLAGPPRYRPAIELASLIKKAPVPDS